VTRGRVAWAIAVVDVIAASLVTSLQPSEGGVAVTVLYATGIASLAGVGALLCTRVASNAVGILLLAAGTSLAAGIVAGTYAGAGGLQVPQWPGTALAGIIGNALFLYAFAIALIGVPLLFPDGRLAAPRFRWAVWIVIADMAALTLVTVLEALAGTAPAGAPTGGDSGPISLALTAPALIGLLVSLGAAVASVALRFRHGSPLQRQQVKSLMTVAAVGAGAFALSVILAGTLPDVAGALSVIGILAGFALPLAIAVAILRYRLFELDRIISRTIGWGLVTVALVVVFALAVVGLQAVLVGFTQGQTLAVAASTLAAFALFQPLRRRVQRAVDHRFDRARYDGEKKVDEFGERLRERVELTAIRGDVLATVDMVVRPSSTGLWLRGPRSGSAR
jgi:hypothetical protein